MGQGGCHFCVSHALPPTAPTCAPRHECAATPPRSQALSNLCLDIVVEVPQLPPADEPARRALLQQLTAAPPPQEQWEVGAGHTGTAVWHACVHTTGRAGPELLQGLAGLGLARYPRTPAPP